MKRTYGHQNGNTEDSRTKSDLTTPHGLSREILGSTTTACKSKSDTVSPSVNSGVSHPTV